MSRLAYIKGEEEKALWYYCQRIKYEIDPQERCRLQEIINELKKLVEPPKQNSQSKKDDDITLTSITLSSCSQQQ